MKIWRPYKVFCDFDGTIITQDGTDALLERFASPSWLDWERLWQTGALSARDCLSRQVESITASRESLVAFAAELPIDPGIFDLIAQCRTHGIPFTVVSDGLDLIVDTVLKRHGLQDIRHFSNHLEWKKAGSPTLSFPNASPDCESGAGTCKCAITQAKESGAVETVYIGDGRSDFCVSPRIKRLYAKGSLRDWCVEQHIAHHPFANLSEVSEHLFRKEAHV